ncbi:MAG TPA: hypothetical protein VLG50_03415 [Candidatus Saccharimonadales bacterium]|nr:hypothetical protein [Candidatus Saccharimonadales bacterium]
MKHNLKRLLLLSGLLFSIITEPSSCCDIPCPTGCTQSQNLWQPHAFGTSMSREIILEMQGWASDLYREGWFGTFGVAADFQTNISKKNCSCCPVPCCKNIGSIPFWSSNFSNQMTLGDNSGAYDLDVYQMGMGPVTTNGTVILSPVIYQAGVDLLLYLGNERDERGWWMKLKAPIGVTAINPLLIFSCSLEPAPYPVGTLDPISAIAAPNKNIAQAFASDVTTGFLQPMIFGRIDCKRISQAHFGDLEFAFGYNVVADSIRHLGIGLRIGFPTGNRANGFDILQPIFGRNGHGGVGAEIIGHWNFWECDNDNQYGELWFDGMAMHLFRSHHRRSFDLAANGLGSKYLLVAKYSGDLFQNEIQNVVNISTLEVSSKFMVEGNFAFGLDYHYHNWGFMIGYEGWGRSCEQLSIDCSRPGARDFNQYAVLGRQSPFTSGGQPLNLSQPSARIGKSQDRVEVVPDPSTGIVLATDPANRLPSSASDALDIQAQRAHAAYTSKPFAQVQYTWRNYCYIPYFGVSGGYEFSHFKNSAVNLWNISAQGGITF